jgi:hypothetical protein
MNSQKYSLGSLTLEELILLREEAEDKLNKNPLDGKALSEYNLYSEMILRLENA